MSHVTGKILSKHKVLFNWCDCLIALSDTCFKKYERRQKRLVETEYGNIVLAFTSRSFKSFQVVCLLSREGFAQDAQFVTRTMFENLVNMKWIGIEPCTHSLLWKKSQYEDGIKWATAIVKYPNDHWNVKDQVEQDKKSMQKKLKAFEKKHDRIAKKLPNLLQRCEQVGLEYLYHHIYRPYSHMSHGGLGALASYFQKGEINTRIDCTPSDKDVDIPLFYAFKLFSLILDGFAEKFNLLTDLEKADLGKMPGMVFNKIGE